VKTATTLTLLSLTVLTLAAFTTREQPSAHRPVPDGSWFLAEMHGTDIHASPEGMATYGTVDAHDGSPAVFTLSLGADGANGSVLFTRTNGGRLLPGTYTIGGRDDGSDEIRALVMTGTATHPTGVFRGHSGQLVVTMADDNVIRGRFTLDATGFVASAPNDETRQIQATGMFTAMRQVAR
jgi:hypothetical protein